ncbi:MAG TPA: hypothetical protein VGM01_04395 [Ktedonobacteraceae bacterium]
MIRELYPDADALALLTRLPERTWTAIKVQADVLGIIRERGSNTTTAYREYDTASIQDVEFAQKHNLTLKDTNPQWIRLCACR